MKCKKTKFVDKAVKSPPSRGAWIEIIRAPVTTCTYRPSPPSRGAWIEICCRHRRREGRSVAPLAGGVD